MNNLPLLGDLIPSDILKDIPWWGYVFAIVWWCLGILVIVRAYKTNGVFSAVSNGIFFVVSIGIFGPLTTVFASVITNRLKYIFEPFTKPFSK